MFLVNEKGKTFIWQVYLTLHSVIWPVKRDTSPKYREMVHDTVAISGVYEEKFCCY